MDSTQLREQFLDYFIKNDHVKVKSSSLVPINDPTLLFANAGMNQFKDNFTGMANPENKRVTSVQKCVRAGGKHNDLENVGFTARHHTFFEMLGNFSFGDYFKKEAIHYAWDFLTNTLNISKDKLYVTVHKSDQDAADIWHNQEKIPREKIFFRDDKDNFWEMGETGPCGPCSEIFFDHGEKYSDGSDTSKCILDDESRYVEIWNLVFMQYEKYNDNGEIKMRNLPKPSVDTGAGLERLAAVIEGVYWNYDSKLFLSLISDIRELVGSDKIKEENDTRILNIVADHMRSSTMLITDGVIPGNEGRGYVLRSIIRRAVRYLHKLEVTDITLYKLVPSVFKTLGEEYPENAENASLAQNYLKLEEENFRRTLEIGTQFLEDRITELLEKDERQLEGAIAFKLHDTYGFPFDLTASILKEKNLTVDEQDFNNFMNEQKERSKKTSNFSHSMQDTTAFYKVKEQFGETIFLGYDWAKENGKLIAQIDDDKFSYLIFDQTPFYGESGGQQGDKGDLLLKDKSKIAILDTQKPIEGLIVHITNKIEKSLKLNDTYELVVDSRLRAQTAKNHSATHLLQAALIKVLGDHVKQSGSQVTNEKLRFDFTHTKPLSYEQINEVEFLINSQIQNALEVSAQVMTIDIARKKGAMALFGEKYGNEVRVLEMGDFSIELCGGIHVRNTQEIGLFVILQESSLSSGIRRLEATTSTHAYEHLNQRSRTLKTLEKNLSVNSADVLEKVRSLQEEEKEARRVINDLKSQIQSFKSEDLFNTKLVINSKRNLVSAFDDSIDPKDLRSISDKFIDKNKDDILLLGTFFDQKLSYLLRTHKDNKNINCSSILKDAQANFAGRGGGKPDMAQGSCEKNVKSELTKLILETLRGL